MRTINFRVWDNRLNLFNYFNLNNIAGNLPSDCFENVQQFIGLSDKAGTLIYEGDIVKYDEGGYSCSSEVVFSDSTCGFVLDSSRRHKLGDEKYGDYIPIYGAWKNRLEVIGNIFENIELLNQ